MVRADGLWGTGLRRPVAVVADGLVATIGWLLCCRGGIARPLYPTTARLACLGITTHGRSAPSAWSAGTAYATRAPREEKKHRAGVVYNLDRLCFATEALVPAYNVAFAFRPVSRLFWHVSCMSRLCSRFPLCIAPWHESCFQLVETYHSRFRDSGCSWHGSCVSRPRAIRLCSWFRFAMQSGVDHVARGLHRAVPCQWAVLVFLV